MKRIVSLLLCLMLMSVVLIACDDRPIEEFDDYPLSFDWQEFNFSDDFNEFFDINTKISIDIDISTEQLLLLENDHNMYSSRGSKSPVYRMCNVTITYADTTVAFPETGIRMKGNTSRRNFVNENGEMYYLVHFKLSFKQTFDADDKMIDGQTPYYATPKTWESSDEKNERKDRTFLGMESLDIKWNKNYDQSHIREYYSSQYFQSQGVLAANINIGQVTLSTTRQQGNLGVYTIYEPIDANFISRRVRQEDRGGDLYKLGWPADFTKNGIANANIGVEDEDANYFPVYDLKENKKTSTHEALKNVIYFLDNPANITDIENYVDMDYFCGYEAAAYFVGNPDDLRYNMNNTYLYFLKSTGKMIVIPYDYDRCFGINMDWNPSGNGLTDTDPYGKFSSYSDSNQYSPLYLKTILRGGNADYIYQFKTALHTAVQNQLLNPEIFSTYYEIAKDNYSMCAIPTIKGLTLLGVGFSNDVQNKLNRTDMNIDFATYINLKKANFLKYS